MANKFMSILLNAIGWYFLPLFIIAAQDTEDYTDKVSQQDKLVSMTTDPKVDNCIGKVRSIAGVDLRFRTTMDLLAQTARLDVIDRLLRDKISMVCTDDEIKATKSFLDEEQLSVQVVQSLSLNLTNEERTRINTYENTSDIQSLRQFFLDKFQKLPREQYDQLRKSYNKLIGKLANCHLKNNIAHFITDLSPKDQKKLTAYGTVSEEDKIGTYVEQKMARSNMTDADKNEIRKYLKGLFMSIKLD